jgi:hypothetical protein
MNAWNTKRLGLQLVLLSLLTGSPLLGAEISRVAMWGWFTTSTGDTYVADKGFTWNGSFLGNDLPLNTNWNVDFTDGSKDLLVPIRVSFIKTWDVAKFGLSDEIEISFKLPSQSMGFPASFTFDGISTSPLQFVLLDDVETFSSEYECQYGCPIPSWGEEFDATKAPLDNFFTLDFEAPEPASGMIAGLGSLLLAWLRLRVRASE